MAVDKDLEDLAFFLKSPSPNLRKAAVEIVQGLSGTDEGVRRLSSHASALFSPLVRILVEAEEVSKPAAEALVNLSQDVAVVDHSIRVGAVERAMELIGKPGSKLNKFMVMLLVNISNIDKGASRLLQEGDEKLAGLNIAKLVRFFSRFSSSEVAGDDEYEHVANILVNITRLEFGRKVVLDMSKGILRQILPQIDSRSVVRRQGVAGTVRNCCFDAETYLPSLLLASEFLWPALLLPLAGTKVYSELDTAKMPLELATPLSQEDRELETDPKVRVEACEAIYLLLLQEGGRRAFWAINGPRILELGYEEEEDPKVMEAFERVGALLVGGSGTDEEAVQA
ncbi:uncharacterized protein [Physcomitrium patens]|uniref:Protein HGH1 homolog n=1 Tax=Physcomitrium patens TaxID=3218 RepID=A0A2K1KFL9_PHYPA|nr:protein HGH1 homolog [Physcomitrium patens]PNR52572.1 hypothetical protein PHYPA_008946 [Physcomitrium patens]|eukprot:XP_024378321.1 protein HGH1 homolog [Physcomitrella patens]